MRLFQKAALAASLSFFGTLSQAAEQYIVDVGAEVTRGDYGTADIATVWSLPIGIRYQGERFSWSLSVPYLIVEAPSNFVVTGGGSRGYADSGLPGGGGSKSTRTVSGLGDVTAAVGWLLVPGGEDRPWLGLNGEVKFATADESENLGTGENDYAVQIAAGAGWLSGRLGYRSLGDSSTVEYEDPVYYAVSVSHVQKNGSDIGLEWYSEQATVSGGDDRQEVTLFGSFPVRADLRVHGYLFKGLTDASADFGAGLNFAFTL